MPPSRASGRRHQDQCRRKKRVVEGLDQIGHDRRSRRPVKEDDLVHHERAAKPCLIDVRAPFGRRRVVERSSKGQGRESVDCRLRTPELRCRVSSFPLREMKVVQLVGAYEMSDPAYAVDFGPEVVSELDWRPHPKAFVRQTHDDGAGGVREPIEIDGLAVSKPQRLVEFLQARMKSPRATLIFFHVGTGIGRSGLLIGGSTQEVFNRRPSVNMHAL